VLTFCGTRRDFRRCEKLLCTQPFFGNCILKEVEIDPRPEKDHNAALKIQRLWRGFLVRKQLAAFDDILEEETEKRDQILTGHDAFISSAWSAFQFRLMEILLEAERTGRAYIVELEMRTRSQKADIKMLETIMREVLFRQQLERAEEHQLFAIFETLERNVLMEVSRSQYEHILKQHRLWFRCHWMQFYIELEEYQSRLNTAALARKVVRGVTNVPRLRHPPTDFDFASSMVAFPKEFRKLRTVLKAMMHSDTKDEAD
jgi:myosin heavy subunit